MHNILRIPAVSTQALEMRIGEKLHQFALTSAYWSQVALFEGFGPANLDQEHDPIERLKREYGKDRPKRPGRVDY